MQRLTLKRVMDGPRSPLGRFLWARFIGQVALNAALYALLISVVEESSSSFASTLFVAAFVAPSILLGVPGGIVADALPLRFVLTASLVLRAVLSTAFIIWSSDLTSLLLLVAILATIGQAYAPAESATIPELVPAESLARANAWSNFVLVGAQVLGGVAIAPVLLKLLDARAVFAFAAALFLVAAMQMARVPARRTEDGERGSTSSGTYSPLMVGWRVLRHDGLVFEALVRLTLLGTVLKVLVAIAPILTRDVLGIAVANTVFIMAPAAVGSAFGLLIVAPLARAAGASTLGRIAFLLFAAGVIALATAEPLSAWVEGWSTIRLERIAEISRVPTLVTVVMLIAAYLGAMYAVAGVATRTVVNGRSPRGFQGRVFATYQTIADIVSLPPLLLAGALVDRIGTDLVLLGMGILCVAGEALLARRPWRG
ncbi:MAG: MFS transporter [Dehalococcoidia bacterium]